MGDVDIGASSDCNLERDLEAQPQATGFELQQIDPEEHLRRRPCSRPTGTQVQKGTDAPTLRFYQPFFEPASQDNGPDRCLFICWGPPGNQRAIDIPVSDPNDEVIIFSDI